METRRVTQLIVVITLLSLYTMGCKNRNSSANANTGLSSTQNNNISANSSSQVSKRFVGTWVEEGKTTDPGAKFTEDGKIIELVGNQWQEPTLRPEMTKQQLKWKTVAPSARRLKATLG
jgi:hypothetical protein